MPSLPELRDMVAGLHIGDATHTSSRRSTSCPASSTAATPIARPVLETIFRIDAAAAVPHQPPPARGRPHHPRRPQRLRRSRPRPSRHPLYPRRQPGRSPHRLRSRTCRRSRDTEDTAADTAAVGEPALPAAADADPARTAGGAHPNDLREALAQALGGNRMELLFQPIINLHGEPHCFYQAQLVLPTADGRLAPAREYMPVAEAAGLSGKVDRTMLLNVIDTLSKYNLEGRRGIAFAGLSPASCRTTPCWPRSRCTSRPPASIPAG